ncbi:MAG: histone deacetylase [Aquabacterium sp.]|uniref:histone deacetylase family protein n=1 Tax=Aquabacterium sp. TaxID=1872578 RepID=UPI003BC8533A
MQAFYADHFVLPLPVGHRFPMAKYALLRDALVQHLPAVQLAEATAACDADLARVHTARYIEAVTQGSLTAAEQREIGFPWSPAMAERARRSVGATLQAAEAVLNGAGVAANLAGGTHHAYADKGSGFCVFNDAAVAARAMQARRPGLKVAIVDLDVHQGNGTANIFQGDDTVFTLSLHGDKNFPFRKEASDLDVPLTDGCTDSDYLPALHHALEQLDQRFQPDVVIYLAGADPHEGDRLGRLKLSDDGMAERDRAVLDWAWLRRLPVVLTMAGGYGHDIHSTVRVQLHTYRIALSYWQRWHPEDDLLANA